MLSVPHKIFPANDLPRIRLSFARNPFCPTRNPFSRCAIDCCAQSHFYPAKYLPYYVVDFDYRAWNLLYRVTLSCEESVLACNESE